MATAFETEMGVMPELSRAVKDMDWFLPTDIQAESVPLILGGGDVLMAAETGSGKTGAFCLPVIQIVYETIKEMDEKRRNPHNRKEVVAHVERVQMSFLDRSEAFATDGIVCQSREAAWNGGRATMGVRHSGKYYHEATVKDEGLCRVGWSMENATYDIGTDDRSYGFGGTGKKSHCRQFDDYGEEFRLHDTVGCMLDLDAGQIAFRKNNRDLGVAYKLPRSVIDLGLVPSVVLKNAEIAFNFGAETDFKYTPPEGYVAFAKAPQEHHFQPIKSASAAKTELQLRDRHPIAVIIEPTRELAEQTFDQIGRFSVHLKDPHVEAVLLIGGGDNRAQAQGLRNSQIVVATPGRLEAALANKEMFLGNCRFFILDECDALLQTGYQDMIFQLHAKMPLHTGDGKRLQMIVCSATLHAPEVKRLASKLMHFPTWVDLKGQDTVPETVHHIVCVVDPNADTSWQRLFGQTQAIKTDGVHSQDRLMLNKFTPDMLSEATKLLKGQYMLDAITQYDMDRAIIFCRTKLDCDQSEQLLTKRGFTCVCLHSDRSTQERKHNLDLFKAQKVRFLICTDVAARGIDVSGLPYVINMTLPDEKQNYVHRIGRVGRAERMGLAISLVATVKEKVWFHSTCKNRGRGCQDTRLQSEGGCCIWYNEMQYLADIEEHLGVTIDQVDRDNWRLPTEQIDGRIVYGQKLKQSKPTYQSHVQQLAGSLKELNNLERKSQQSYLALRHHGLMSS